MAKSDTKLTIDPEIAAINAVILAIRDLDSATQQRVIDYVARRFELRMEHSGSKTDQRARINETDAALANREQSSSNSEPAKSEDGLEGISPVARKWMSRNGMTADGLTTLFSLGIDEIDLVAKKVPGRSKKDRMRSVILLKGVAAYLGTGAARVTHEQVKETCLHYNAFDTDNFASYLKQLSSEVGGTKESGYSLSARGLTAATEMVKEILEAPKK